MTRKFAMLLSAVGLAFVWAAGPARAAMLTGNESLNDRVLTYDTGSIVGSFDDHGDTNANTGTTTFSWAGVSGGLNMDGYRLTYTEHLGETSGWGYNLILDLFDGSAAASLTGGGDIVTSRGARTNQHTGYIRIQNAADVLVGTLNASVVGNYSGQPGTITVSQTGAFSATGTLTSSTASFGGAQSFTGGDGGTFTITAGGMDSTGAASDGGAISIQDYTGVTIAGGIRTPGRQAVAFNVGGNVDIGQAANPIGGNIAIAGGVNTRGAYNPAGTVKLFATGNVNVAGTVDLGNYHGTAAQNGYMELHSTGGAVTLGDQLNGATVLDLIKMQYILIDSTADSYLYYDLDNFVAGTDPSTQIRVANSGQIVYYDPAVNTDLAAGGHSGLPTGQYNLTGGGFLIPVPEPATLVFLALGGLGMIGAAVRRRRRV